MININISKAKTGMVLAKAVYNKEGKLLLEKGKELQEIYIENFKKHNIKDICIYNRVNRKVIKDDYINTELTNRTLNIIKKSYINLRISQKIDIQEIENIVLEIVEDLSSREFFILSENIMKSIDEYNYNHSINVCILSLVLGIALKFNKAELKKLGTGALLHDIGKIKISHKILNKPDLLTDTEYQEIQKHPLFGYEMAKDMEGISKESMWVIRDHHERYDGKGYPNRISGKNIHIYPKIVAICDVYDALTSNRVYRKGIPPNQAIEYLISMGNHQFDYELVRIFIKQICVYPVGTIVRLATGEEAQVIKNHENWPTRPIVRVIKNKKGEPLDIAKEIDLTKQLDNHVVDILNTAL